MIFFKSKEEKEKERQQRELEKQQKENQKQLEKQQKENQKQLEQQQKEQKKLQKQAQNQELDLKDKGPTPIAKDEQILYRWNITKGTFRTRVITSYFVTNYRISTIFRLENNPYIMLENISDVVAINTHREYEGGYRGTTVGSKGMRYTVGGQRGKSVSYGDIIISSPTEQDQTWYNIRDYASVIKLIKSQRKIRIAQLKQNEKMK